jgi:putative NADH-flavin reductase
VKVLVLGATGRVGRLTVDEALARGHALTALVRSQNRLGDLAARVAIVQGDALDPNVVSTAVAGQAAVIYALGAGNVRRTTLFSDSTRILLAAMERHTVQRLIAVTGVGAGDTKGHGGFLYDRILYPLFTKGIYEDKDRQEALLRQSRADWTIVRPAPFRTSRPPGPLRAVTSVDGVCLRRVALSEVAAFVVEELTLNRYVRQAVFIGHE